ncbi:MAG: sugar epimerase [Sulfurovum sp. PC08-66]|nr:MAG: sugar epimerase [Sulfurovum sp. PC08-66]KIM12450.1 MAG: sugar epimerase [Sulfuricurvum sp. PC08-66]
MNIFITGASGFVGSHLKAFLSNKYSYTLFTPTSSELDLADEAKVDAYILSNKIDIILHLANRGGGRDTAEMKSVTEYNLRIFFNIAKHEKNVQKIISFGSGAEYGKHKPVIDAKEEEYLASYPLDEYGFYKSITSHYIEKCDNIVQLRIFGAYGEHENYRFKFISNAVVKNLLHLPITINKNVFFDYIYIDDLIRMIDWFIHHEAKEKIYNVSRGEKIDLITLAKLVNQQSDFQSEIITLNEGLNNEYTSSNKRVLEAMGGFTFTSHGQAIAKMRSYFEQNFALLDTQTIREDPYLKIIDTMWKEKK